MLKLNHDFLKKIKYLKHNHIIILLYLYSWITSRNPPMSRKFEKDDKVYYWISINKIAQDLLLTRTQVQNALYRLENKDKKIETVFQPFIYPKQDKKENKMYLAFNLTMANFLLEKQDNFFSNLKKKLTGNTYKTKKFKNDYIRVDDMLLDDLDIDTNAKKYDSEAEAIARRIIVKYRHVFNHRIPKQGVQPTKTFVQICCKIQDIYLGVFSDSRRYPLSQKFLDSKQFNLDEYKDTLSLVKGDWNKVRRLLFTSLNNFQKMFDEDKMPLNKKYLQNNLNLWLYDPFTISGEPQSQFIQSFKPPNITSKQFSENKADRIFNELPEGAKDGANDLYDLSSKGTPAGTFFENVQKIVAWAKIASEKDVNFHFWCGRHTDILCKFAEYCRKNNINVSTATVNIEKSVKSNGPWCWFLSQAIKEHNLNRSLVNCVTQDDFVDCYCRDKMTFCVTQEERVIF